MKTIYKIFIIVGIVVPSLISNGYAICADESIKWWEPCNDTGNFTDGMYVKYSILIPALLVIIGGIIFVMFRRRK